jgi:hypothetical protein
LEEVKWPQMRSAVRLLKTLAIPLLMLPLCACYADQKREIAACQHDEFESFFAYKSIEAPQALVDSDETHLGVANCMTKKGYVEDWSHRRCGSKLNVEVNAYCYAPAGKFAFLAHKIGSVFAP